MDMHHWYILKQWIGYRIFVRSDWLLKLGIASAIHLRTTHVEIVIVDRNE